MATRFYLHDAAHGLTGTLPTGEQGAGTPTKSWAGATSLKKMDTTIGAGQATKTDTVASASAQRHFIGFWASDPLAAQTISAQTWTFWCADSESNTSANFFANLLNVYVWRPSTGAKVGTIIDGSNGASQGGSEATSANAEQVTTWTFSGSSVTTQAGDVIIVEVWAVFTPAMSNTYDLTFYFDGTTDTGAENAAVASAASYLEAANNLTFASTNYDENGLAETVSVSESVATVVGRIEGGMSDTVDVSDAVGAVSGWIEPLPESVTVSEIVAAVSGFLSGIGETVTVTDAIADGRAVEEPPLEESVAVADATAEIVGMPEPIEESVTVSEVIDVVAGLLEGLPESVTTTDAQATVAAFLAGPAESVAVADQVVEEQETPGNDFLEPIEEEVPVADVVATGYAAAVEIAEVVAVDEGLDVEGGTVAEPELRGNLSRLLIPFIGWRRRRRR